MKSRMRISLFAGLLASAAAAAEPAQLLVYRKSEPGVEPYLSRLIVTERYLRLDDGEDAGNFALFDRKTRTIHSVSHGEQSIAEISARPVELEPPQPLALREEQVALGKGVPEVAGRKPQQHRLLSGERVCMEVVAVPGMMEQAVAARREFRQVLAGEHAAMLPHIPADLHDPCDLAVHTFRPGWLLQFGLPIEERDFAGNSQSLVDFNPAWQADPALFLLPEGYGRYSISDLKE